MNWIIKQLLGLSIRNMEELIRAVALGVNMVEIRLGDFYENGTPLYRIINQKVVLNHKILRRIIEITKKSVNVQFHFPMESNKDIGLSMADKKNHGLIIAQLMAIEKIHRQYGKKIGYITTIHPPGIPKGVSESEALEAGRVFFEELDRLRIETGCKTLICVENMPERSKYKNIGTIVNHFKVMLRNTRSINLIIDQGHRRLSDDFSVAGCMGIGIVVRNFHFHGNDKNTDQHLLPNKDNVTGYDNYLRYFRRNRPSVVIEIDMEKYSDAELREFLTRFCNEIK